MSEEIVPLRDAAEVHDHWWPRPGWRPGRLFYTWHLTFDGAHELHRLVQAYQRRLVILPGLNLVPPTWLHMTVQGLGFEDETPTELVDQVIDAVSERLRDVPPVDLTFDRPVVLSEAIALPPGPTGAVHTVHSAICHGIADVVGPQKVHSGPEQAHGFRPHVSLAYFNTDGPSEPYVSALRNTYATPAHVRVADVSLIVLDRVLDPDWLYRWTIRATAALGAP